MSTRFVSIDPSETSAAIEKTLAQLGTAVGADAVYVLRYDEGFTRISEVFEWNNLGGPRWKEIEGISTDKMGWWLERLQTRENIIVEDFETLGPEALSEKQMAELLEVRSSVNVPMVSGTRLVGQLGFASREPRVWPDIVIGLFRVCGEVIASALDRSRVELALRASEQRYRTLFERNLAGVFRSTPDGRILECNHACARIFGYDSPEQLMAMPAEASYQDDATRLDFIARLHKQGTLTNVELPMRRRDGTPVWIIENVSLIKDPDDGEETIEGAMFDITETRLAQDAVRLSENRYRLLFEQNPAGVFRATQTGEILDSNLACARLLGYDSPAELLKRNVRDFFLDPRQFSDELARVSDAGDILKTEAELRRTDGTTIWTLVNATWRQEGSDEPVMEGGIVDITERKRAEELIEYQAYHDSLTGLPNRNLLRDRLRIALANARRSKTQVAVIFLDLDEFKLVNDTLGHTIGDQLLQQIAKRVENAIRDGDTVARMGGDEFTVLATGIESDKTAVMIAEKLIEEVAESTEIEGHLLYPTVSIGIAMFPGDGEDAEALLRQADVAMYRAKETGRNNYQLATPAMNQRAVERLNLERNLRVALERNELVLHYQPQINLVTDELCGLEALIRWNHPDKGLLSPGFFIPIAEETRLIVPIGEWVAQEACRTARLIAEFAPPGLRVSINISARMFRQSNLVQTIRSVLDESGIDPNLLELEITESLAMQSTDWTLETLRQLKSLGVQIAIDDFGTGYSSLSYLKQFPIDRLKIDQSFVRDLETSEPDAAIVAAIIAMSDAMELHTIAEGVETEGQKAFLATQGCGEMQGYLFSRPLPRDELFMLIRSRVNT